VGLSAVMIAAALGARVVAVDIDPEVLRLATEVGAEEVINGGETKDVPRRIHELTGRGAHVSIDALGSAVTSADSIACLRKRGRHVQVGLLAGDDFRPPLPMELVIGRELELVGSHGLQAHRYPEMLELIAAGRVEPQRLVGKTVSLEEAPAELEAMGGFGSVGITVIDRF
jgi:alcohol dehydrogenase